MSEKKKELSTNEAFAKVFATTYNFVFESTRLSIKFYEIEYKRLQREMIKLEENEPLKIFKKSHKNWEDKLQDLKQKYDDSFTKYIKECEELENVMNLFNV